MATAASEVLTGPQLRDEAGDDAKRRRCLKRWLELDTVYRTWKGTHQDIIDFVQPNRGEFVSFEVNRGDRRDDQIVNNTGGDGARKLEAAMDTGITSEAREWVTFSPEDPNDAESEGNREYCHTVQSIFFALASRSNFYPANRNVLADMIGPAIGVMLIEEDPQTVWRCKHLPIGSYRVAANAQGKVDTLIEMYTLTARQMAQEFGEENCSLSVQIALANETVEVPFRVLHLIEPRAVRRYGKIDGKNKPWASFWLEIGQGTWNASVLGSGDLGSLMTSSKILRESGYDEQPFIAARWNSMGMDAYGKDSPGWNALGDIKGLQSWELASAKALAKIVDPPMNQPADLHNASLLPGALNPLPNDSKAKFEPAVVIPPETITVAANEKRVYEQRIDRSFYGDVLFLLSRDQQAQPRTAEEIRGQKEERLLQLGGVFARYADEGLKPAIARFFAMAQRAGKFPPPPPEMMRTGKIKIDFQNPLVTAQKTIGFTAMQQLVSFGIGVAQAKAAGADKLDGDEMMDTAAEMLGTKPNLLKSDDQLAQERQQAQAAAQGAAQGTAMTQAAPAIKDLSNADPEKLRALVQQFGPAATAQATA